jgi:hypothetical protein
VLSLNFSSKFIPSPHSHSHLHPHLFPILSHPFDSLSLSLLCTSDFPRNFFQIPPSSKESFFFNCHRSSERATPPIPEKCPLPQLQILVHLEKEDGHLVIKLWIKMISQRTEEAPKSSSRVLIKDRKRGDSERPCEDRLRLKGYTIDYHQKPGDMR